LHICIFALGGVHQLQINGFAIAIINAIHAIHVRFFKSFAK